MSPFAHRAAVMAALLVAAGCSDGPAPSEPSPGAPPPAVTDIPVPAPFASRQQVTNERLARRFAIALRDSAFRGTVMRSLQTSSEPEGKVHLQRFLGRNRGAMGRRLATLAGESQGTLDADLASSPAIEIYLPVPEHRSRWRGDLNVLVATAEWDRDAPVAFDPYGRRHVLDPDRPPGTPVIALGRAETQFTEPGMAFVDCETCFEDPPSGGNGGGGGAGPAVVSAGLYMTYAKFDGTFEGYALI